MQLVDKYQPKQFDEFIGLARPKAIISAFLRQPYASSWLFVGSSGVGKTSFAFAVARLLNAEIHHIPAQNCTLERVEEVCRKCEYVPMFGESAWHVVIVDEADRMSHAAQLAFLSKLDGTAPPPNTILFFTANETNLLKGRFLSRCRVIEFKADGMVPDIAVYLEKVYEVEAPGQKQPDFEAIAKRSGSNIRNALMELELEVLCPTPIEDRAPEPEASKSSTSKKRPATPAADESLISVAGLSKILSVDMATIYGWKMKAILPPPTVPRPAAWALSVIQPFIDARLGG
jgi:replication-associated recombination protein RarA